ncbi:polysaccharide pyruvyl transferase CsaB [Brevibacillus halotolerans]|uniref:polysaccharide pyruvyl transferase CsaB n=1 Tax=Brevibacillus TaxID=55080 RepID=UPI00215BA24F|nr:MULTISPECIES: polysaccharide pyruvyl transferase CsaB [Brevibacillus]MCR8962007.1 polysaccharide pyruvyl transferase CsaB [Brevibacillus laterosporus]MCZ0834162.1 polysaccharide pyruvyl transferase CsaB [Brevibacillus halotolerans]
MSRILISGYYGFNNAGDDVVLYGIITSLRREQPNISLSVLSNTPERTTSLFGISAHNRWKLSTIVRELKQSDLLVMGGGTLMQDVTSPRSVLYYLGIVTIAKLLGKPVVFYAQGFGPILKSFSRSMIKTVVNHVDVITVRDHESGEDFKACGVTKAPLYVTADPALTIHPEDISDERGAELVSPMFEDSSRPLVIFSVRDWKTEERFKQVIADAADYYQERGWNVLFLPMHFPSDIAPSEDILKAMQHKGAAMLKDHVSFHDIMCILKQSDYVVGMRLHSLILACMLHIPFIGISYDPKIDRFVERAGMTCAGHIKDLTSEQLLTLLDDRMLHLDREQAIIRERADLLKAEAMKSSELVLQALASKK